MMRGEVGKFSNNGETSCSLRYMPSIAEHGNETVETASPANDNNNAQQLQNLNETSTTTLPYPNSGFSPESWNEPPPQAPPAFSILKRNRDGDFKMFSDFNGLDNQVKEEKEKNLVTD